MRKRIHALILFILTLPAITAAEINFIDINTEADWNTAMRQAKTDKKMIFIDVWAVWCGPCKQMDAQTFADSEVGNYFNTTFVNLSVDGENGYGLRIMEEYGIDAFPTFLFLDPEGKLMNVQQGFMPAPQFINVGKDVIGQWHDSQFLPEKCASGDCDASEISRYVAASGGEVTDNDPIVSNFFADLSDEAFNYFSTWKLIKAIPANPEGPLFKMVENKIEQLILYRGEEEVFVYLAGLFDGLAETAAAKGEFKYLDQGLTAVTNLMRKHFADRIEQEGLDLATAAFEQKISFYTLTENWQGYVNAVDFHIMQNKEQEAEIAAANVMRVLQMEERNLLDAALRWGNFAVQKNPTSENEKIYGLTYAIFGEYDQALRYFNELLSKYEDDLVVQVEIEELIEQIKAAKSEN